MGRSQCHGSGSLELNEDADSPNPRPLLYFLLLPRLGGLDAFAAAGLLHGHGDDAGDRDGGDGGQGDDEQRSGLADRAEGRPVGVDDQEARRADTRVADASCTVAAVERDVPGSAAHGAQDADAGDRDHGGAAGGHRVAEGRGGAGHGAGVVEQGGQRGHRAASGLVPGHAGLPLRRWLTDVTL